ncbi:MAG: DUF4124 domain-containing protein [Methylohalobius sp.]|nr:DUF4124 domain-containing protein [Methylohalobius sp.]
MRRVSIGLCLILLAVSWAGENPSGKLYQWVDNQGKVHYSDPVPAEAAEHERVIFDKSRVRKLEVVEKPKTAEELAREARLAELRAAERRLLEEQLARDQALLRTYRTEEDLELARKGQLDTIAARIKVLEANIKRQQALLEAKIQEAAEIERQGRQVPQGLMDAVASIRHQIEQHRHKIERELAAREELERKFALDLARFKNLKARLESGVNKTATTRPDSEPSSKQRVILSVAHCRQESDCDQAWQLARIYVQTHATTALFIDSDIVLHTEDPRQDQDISLTVARIKGKNGEDTLFLDVRCKLSGIGQRLCQSDKVREIRAGFATFIEEGLRSAAK